MPWSGSYNDKNLIIKTAQKYYAAGLWPIAKDGKKNYTREWPTKRVDESELLGCLKKGWGLGIVLGPHCGGIVCVDIDRKATKDGLPWLQANEQFIGNCIIENTPSGGYHLYYRYPSGEAGQNLRGLKRKSHIAPGVECLVSHAQVNTWPTVNDKNQPYRIISPGHNDLTDIEKVDELPSWIINLIPKEPPYIKKGFAPGESADPTDLRFAKIKLDRHGPAVDGNRGNDHTYKAALIGHDYGIPQDQWLNEMLTWNASCLPPWHQGFIVTTVERAYQRARGGFGNKSQAARAIAAAQHFPDDLPVGDPNADADPTPSDDPYDYKNPTASAVQFLRRYRDFVTHHGVFYAYRNHNWSVVEVEDLKSELTNDIIRTTPDHNLKESHKVEILKAIFDLKLDNNRRFDTWSDGRTGDFVRCRNCILRLSDRERLPHTPDWFSTTMLDIDYDPNATAPAWHAFTDSCFPKRPDVAKALNAFCGYSLSSSMKFQRWMVLWGRPRSGKSTAIHILTSLLGGKNKIHPVEIGTLASDFGLAGAEDARLIVISDPHDARREDIGIASTRIKNIVGLDDISINAKFKKAVKARLNAKVIMTANRIPSLSDPDGSLSRKMIPLRYTESYQDREDHGLEDRLMGQLAGILNVFLDAYDEARVEGKLPVPNDVKDELRDIHEQMNPTEAFVAEFIEFIPPDTLDPALAAPSMAISDAHEAYVKWCELRGHQPKSIIKFSQDVRQQFSHYEPKVERVRKRSHDSLQDRTEFTYLRLRVSLGTHMGTSLPDDHDSDVF